MFILPYGLISANKYLSWQPCPKLFRMGSSVHNGYYWFGTVAFRITYRKHAKLSPSSWKTVCGYTAGLSIMLYAGTVMHWRCYLEAKQDSGTPWLRKSICYAW